MPSSVRLDPLTIELRAMSEGSVKATVLDIAKRYGWRVFHLTHDPRGRNTAKGSGYPDLTLARNGDVLWIECKRETENMGDMQLAWAMDLPGVAIIRPRDIVNGTLEEMLR